MSKLSHHILKAISVATTTVILVVDLTTPAGFIVGGLYGIPVALTGLVLLPQWTWTLVALDLACNLIVGALAEPEEGFNWENRILATGGIVLIGFLTTRIQQTGVQSRPRG